MSNTCKNCGFPADQHRHVTANDLWVCPTSLFADSGTGTPPPDPDPDPPPDPDPGHEFNKIIRGVWDWSKVFLPIYTYNVGGIGPNGCVSVKFTVPADAPTGGMGNVSVSPYPGDLSSCVRSVSISEVEADFSKPYPWTRTGADSGIQFLVEKAHMAMPSLTRGKTYYVNVCSRDETGNSTCADSGRACDIKVQCSAPM